MTRATIRPMHRLGRDRASRRTDIRHLGALLALTLSVVACGSPTPSTTPPASPSLAVVPSAGSTGPSASPAPTVAVDPSTVYATIEDQVVAIRQLQKKAPVDPQVLDDAGIKKLTSDSFTKDNPPDLLAANERILKAFGLIPQDASLKDLYVSLLGSQVAGLYSPDDKKLYVVSRSGGLGVAERTTFSHEFTHALQDQNFDLGTLKLDEIGQGDRSFARLALVEGDATLSMTYWQIQNLSQAELGELIAGAGNDPSTKVLLGMPAVLRESLLFPYTQGLAFVQGLQAAGGWQAVDDAFTKPPASTEQIIHPEKYASGEQPIALTLPPDLATRLGSGWKVTLEDSFGEFQLGVWLRQSTTLSAADANAASSGWGGDRVAVVEGPGGAWSVILRTAWDSAQDASEFETAAGPVVDALSNPGSVLPGAGGTERWVVIASNDATLSQVSGVLGIAG